MVRDQGLVLGGLGPSPTPRRPRPLAASSSRCRRSALARRPHPTMPREQHSCQDRIGNPRHWLAPAAALSREPRPEGITGFRQSTPSSMWANWDAEMPTRSAGSGLASRKTQYRSPACGPGLVTLLARSIRSFMPRRISARPTASHILTPLGRYDTFPSGSALASSRCGSSNRSPDQPQGALPQIGALRPALTTDRSTRLVCTRPASPSLAKLAPHLRLPIQNRSVQLDAVKMVKRYLASLK